MAAKADARRSDLADRIADHLLKEGLAAASLRPIADAAGVSDRMLIYYFGTRDEAIEAGLQRAAERMTDLLVESMSQRRLAPDALLDRVKRVVLDDALSPYMALWLEMVARAARGAAPYTDAAAAIAAGFLDWTADQLDVADADRRRTALSVLAQVDGLVVLKAAGLPLSAD